MEDFCKSLTRAAFVVAFFTLLASFLGMLRDRFLAGAFGAGQELDIYYASFRIPDFFYNTILVGLTSSAFLPVLTGYLKKSEKNMKSCSLGEKLKFPKEAEDFIGSLISILSGILLVLGLFVLIFSPFIVEWLTPGFTAAQKAETVNLTRILILSPIFLSFSGLIGNLLNLRNMFFFYSMAPIVYNLGSIFSIFFLVPFLGLSGLAWGIVIGAIGHFLIQFFPARRFGFQFKFKWQPDHPGIKKVWKMMLPRSIHLALLQLNLIITTLFASILPIGSLSVFNFANNLQSLPLGMFGASYAIAAFPTLALLVSKNNRAEFTRKFNDTMCQILFFIVPLSIIMIVLRAQIVRLILGSGKFDWEDTILTLNVLGILTLSLFAQSLNLLFVRAFFALHDTMTPLKSAFIAVFFNISLGLISVKYWPQLSPFLEKETHLSGLGSPIVGLAFAYSISQVAMFIFLLVGLQDYLKKTAILVIQKSLAKIAFASLLMGAVLQAVKFGWGFLIPLESFWAVAGQVALSSICALLSYLFFCKILKCNELKILIDECPKIGPFARKCARK